MPHVSQDDVSLEGAVYPAATPYPDPSRGVVPRGRQPIRRRLGREQGRALERLGHAVEYLIDSRMFLTQVPYTAAEEEAVQILMALNRLVFESCPEVVPMRQRVLNRLRRLVPEHPLGGGLA